MELSAGLGHVPRWRRLIVGRAIGWVGLWEGLTAETPDYQGRLRRSRAQPSSELRRGELEEMFKSFKLREYLQIERQSALASIWGSRIAQSFCPKCTQKLKRHYFDLYIYVAACRK